MNRGQQTVHAAIRALYGCAVMKGKYKKKERRAF